MKITRRDLIHAGCTIAGVTLAPHFMDRAEAGRLFHGGASLSPALPLRNIINMNDFSFGVTDYAFIDHIRATINGSVGPFQSDWNTGPTFPSCIDANGYVNSSAGSGNRLGGQVFVPDPADFGGPYTFDGLGSGNVALILQGGSVATWTTSSPVNCSVTFNSGGSLNIASTATGSTRFSIQISFTCTGTGPQTPTWFAQSFSSNFISNVRFYRTADATDLAAGKIFRSAWKQPIVNMCPSAVRWMNNLGGNSNRNCRFENRTTPNIGSYCTTSQWGISPSYSSNASGTNQYTAAAAVPTTANPKNTTASMTHGEIATVRLTNGFARCTVNTGNGEGVPSLSITNASNGVVTTQVSVTGNANGTTTLTGLSSTANIYPGLPISGTGVPAGTLVQSIVSSSSITVNQNVTTGTGITFAVGTSHGFNTGDVIGHYFQSFTNVVGILNGTTLITGVTSTSNLANGMFVYGPGIPVGATIASFTSNTVTLSTAATISASNINLAFRSMNNLHQLPCTITVVDSTHYQLNVNTTSFGPFATASNFLVTAYQFVTLQVGSGNDRIAYPIVFGDGNTPASYFGNSYLNSNDYKTFYFDKTQSAQTNGSGASVMGVWMFSATAGQNLVAHSGDFPIEVIVACINELNAMSPAHTIGLWINLPAWGLCSIDPDYSSGSSWAINCLDVILNPSSSVRASGYSALGYSGASRLYTPNVICEYSNEVWNGGNQDARGWLTNGSIQRWPTNAAVLSWQDMHALRFTCSARDVKAAAVPNLSQVKFVMGMWGSTGFSPGDFGGNYATVFGGNVTSVPKARGDYYTNDTVVVSGSWGMPISNLDGIAPATYFDPPDTYYATVTGTGTFRDDSAMYNGTDNSANGGGNYTGAANPTQAITNFVAKVQAVGDGTGQSIDIWKNTWLPNYSTTLPSGKVIVNYEGGADWQAQSGAKQPYSTIGGSGYVLTAGDAAFSIGVLDSSQWATAQSGAFNAFNGIAKCCMPALYTWIGAGTPSAPAQRWAYCAPDTYASISGTPTEGAALTVNSPGWIAWSARNVALPS